MKGGKHLRKGLNLTQEDMAMFFNISRPQWALYELGLRDLSIMAGVKESESIRFLINLETSEPKHFPEIAALDSKKDKFIADALKENEFQQIVCKMKIDELRKDYESALKFFQLVDYVLKSPDKKSDIHLSALKVLKDKAGNALDKNGPHQLIKLQLKQLLLEQEKLLMTKLLQ